MNNTRIAALVMVVAAALAPPMAAADILWYGGVGGGASRVEADLNLTFSAFEQNGGGDLVPLIDLTGTDDINSAFFNPRYGQHVEKGIDKANGASAGVRGFLGVMFNRYVGIEVGYANLGTVEDEIELNIPSISDFCTNCRPTFDILLSLEAEIDGYDAYVVGALPLSDSVSLFAKAGVVKWELDFLAKNNYGEDFPTDIPERPTVLPLTFRSEIDGTDIAGAVGMDYTVDENIRLRMEGLWYDVEDLEQSWLLSLNLVLTY